MIRSASARRKAVSGSAAISSASAIRASLLLAVDACSMFNEANEHPRHEASDSSYRSNLFTPINWAQGPESNRLSNGYEPLMVVRSTSLQLSKIKIGRPHRFYHLCRTRVVVVLPLTHLTQPHVLGFAPTVRVMGLPKEQERGGNYTHKR